MTLLHIQHKERFPKYLLILILSFSSFFKLKAQCDCPYPILFIHGWTGDYTSWMPVYTDNAITTAWGPLADTYDAVLNANTQSNAYGADNTALTGDDDALFQFANDPNTLAAGCLYAIDFDWYWDENQNNPSLQGTSAPAGESDSNQASIEKQGWAVGQAIEAILVANPDKEKVVIVGHSMGGLAAREYLQRFENNSYTWWVDPTDTTNGHKVAKIVTAGTPHRGSNASLGNLGSIFDFDERSESVRDLRFSYSTGIFSPRESAPYLFSGPEDDHVDDSYFKSADVDCDGDYDTSSITSINEIGSGDAWDGTKDNPSMPLPNNVKYSYYTSYSAQDITLLQFNGGDGVVADERQWIYSGGNGSTNDFQNGSSIPEPNDGVDHRLSERVHSAQNEFHTAQPGDVDDIVRLMDEADYPFFAYDINTGIDYAGISQIRADFVPQGSEYTNSGSNTIDGDWYKISLAANTPGLDLYVTPNATLSGRLDFYEVMPGNYDNSNAPTHSLNWAAGSGQQVLTAQGMCLAAGEYYLRITHEGLTGTSWETPYKFRVDELPCTSPIGLSATVTALTAQLNWSPSICVSQYEVKYREIGSPTWIVQIVTANMLTVTGLIPDKDYEFEVSTDCGSGYQSPSVAMPFSTTGCPSVLYIPSDPALTFVPEGVYQVDQIITSDGLILNGTDVTYYAGDNVELLSTFQVETGANFLADIQNCTASPIIVDVNSKKKLSATAAKAQVLPKKDRLALKAIPIGKSKVKLVINTDKKEIQSLALYDAGFALKKKLDNSLGQSVDGTIDIDMSDWKPGKYFVMLTVNGQQRVVKLVRRPDLDIPNRN